MVVYRDELADQFWRSGQVDAVHVTIGDGARRGPASPHCRLDDVQARPVAGALPAPRQAAARTRSTSASLVPERPDEVGINVALELGEDVRSLHEERLVEARRPLGREIS